MLSANRDTLPVAPLSALLAEITPGLPPLRARISAAHRIDEREAVAGLLAQLPEGSAGQEQVRKLAHGLVLAVREQRVRASGVDALMHEFALSSQEGVALMCLAEALLRIPDAETADRLIADKLSKGDWRRHLGGSPSLFVNATAWGLLITGKLLATNSEQGLGAALTRLIARSGEPVIRKAVDLAMRMLGNQFVMGQTIEAALARSGEKEAQGYRYSYDMLGEAALTAEDAERYFDAYVHALHAIGTAASGRGIKEGPGISVKLSALHPRYSRAQRSRVMAELLPRLKQLVFLARHYDIGLNIDAEESERLELSLDLLEALAFDPELAGFDGLGFVVQAYQKRCPFVIDHIVDLARRSARKFMIRLVKGAYWDAEIKRAQVEGLSDYPVYTRKVYTDLSYLVCARKLLSAGDVIYPQFATHNAHTLATIFDWAEQAGMRDYEFQCLHGMGESLYDQVVGKHRLNRPCRIYAPVGSHQTLLAYLVRRLLENGSNSSFVNQIVDPAIPIEALLADPFQVAQQLQGIPHPAILRPSHILGSGRRNSTGLDLHNEIQLQQTAAALAGYSEQRWEAYPLLAAGSARHGYTLSIHNPADRRDLVGTVLEAGDAEVEAALAAATDQGARWHAVPAAQRAILLERAAELLEQHRFELMALAIREAGKSIANALAEVREAVDFLRYYAAEIKHGQVSDPLGTVACISPWNFPLAIFIGEVSASLAAGNLVVAKPAEQTPLIAFRAVQLLRQAGIPPCALQFLPGRGETVGARLTADRRVDGVMFTGSTEVAQIINRTLTRRSVTEARELVLVAETGGQNAMIVDSSALPEQVVQDVLASAYDSAGQRCSALRVLCLQEEIADRVLHMLKGAINQLVLGNPALLSTDVGPVIDEAARTSLLQHLDRMRASRRNCYQLPLPAAAQPGCFVAPALVEIPSLSALRREVFGPVLHVLRYKRDELAQLMDAIHATGYGLTLGIHSRIDETIDFIISRAHVGNIYVNRNMIGAVVGVQPFGGEGMSGTGPKAGGPLYLKRLQRCARVHRNDLGLPSAPPAVNGLQALADWAGAAGQHELQKKCMEYQEDSLVNAVLVLPGPTGERNTLRFTARGNILCAALSTEGLLNQMAAAVACGNNVLLTRQTADRLPPDLPQAVLARVTAVSELDESPIQAALVESGLAETAPALARREGALIPVIPTAGLQTILLWRLVAERAVCINTAAAGGNTSLMSLPG